MRVSIVFLLMLLTVSAKSQQLNKDSIIALVKELYEGDYSISVKQKFKSSIALDTSHFSYWFYVQSYYPEFNALIVADDSLKYIVRQRKYIVYSDSDRQYLLFSGDKVKQMGYYASIKKFSFNTIEGQLKQSDKLVENSLYYIFSFRSKKYYINKKTFELDKLTQEIQNKYGIEYSENQFIKRENKINIDSLFDYISKNYGIRDKSQKNNGITENSIGSKFPPFSLITMKGKTYNSDNIRGKSILFDFFYESCLPCIKAFPELIKLRNDADTNLIIIGVDPFPQDTVLIKQFVAKYKINYEVAVGESAVNFWKLVRNSGYPFLIYVNQDGIIQEVLNGYWPAGFRRLRTKIF